MPATTTRTRCAYCGKRLKPLSGESPLNPFSLHVSASASVRSALCRSCGREQPLDNRQEKKASVFSRHLQDGEVVVEIASNPDTVALTNRRILVMKPGGSITEFPFVDGVQVEAKEGFVFGKLSIRSRSRPVLEASVRKEEVALFAKRARETMVAWAALPDEKQCVFCAETIKAAAAICRFCNREQPTTVESASHAASPSGNPARTGPLTDADLAPTIANEILKERAVAREAEAEARATSGADARALRSKAKRSEKRVARLEARLRAIGYPVPGD